MRRQVICPKTNEVNNMQIFEDNKYSRMSCETTFAYGNAYIKVLAVLRVKKDDNVPYALYGNIGYALLEPLERDDVEEVYLTLEEAFEDFEFNDNETKNEIAKLQQAVSDFRKGFESDYDFGLFISKIDSFELQFKVD